MGPTKKVWVELIHSSCKLRGRHTILCFVRALWILGDIAKPLFVHLLLYNLQVCRCMWVIPETQQMEAVDQSGVLLLVHLSYLPF